MNLFKAELHRLARRRLSLIFGAVAVGGIVLLSGLMWVNSSTGPSESDIAEAQAIADAENAQYEACAENEDFFDEDDDYAWVAEDPYYEDLPHEQVCSQFFWNGAEAEDFLWVYTFDFSQEGVLLVSGIGIIVGLLAMMLAASSIGAEWSSGGIANLLVWHPGRMRVWGTKLAASLAVCAGAAIAMMALAFALLYLTASVRGETGTLNASWWGDALGVFSRSAALALGMTLVGASLAMLGRHTAIAGGVIAGYLIVGEMIVTISANAMQMKFPELFSLYTWAGAWVNGRIELYSWTSETNETLVVTAGQAGLLLGGIVALFTGLATWAFAKRDVT